MKNLKMKSAGISPRGQLPRFFTLAVFLLFSFTLSFTAILPCAAQQKKPRKSDAKTDKKPERSEEPGYESPQFSPDGEKFVYVKTVGGIHQLWIMRPDLSDDQKLTPDEEMDETDPSWVPDGTGIVYSAKPKGGKNRDLYFYSMNDAWAFPITETPGNERMPAVSPLKFRKSSEFMKSADPGDYKIAFISDEGGAKNLWTMNLDGRRRMRLTDKQGDIAHPAWAPDASYIAYDVTAAGVSKIVYLRLPQLYIEDEELEQSSFAGDYQKINYLKQSIANASRPAPAPDGQHILYVSGTGADSQAMLGELDGKNPVPIKSKYSNIFLSWRPGGRQFLELSGRKPFIINSPVPVTDIKNLSKMKPGPASLKTLLDSGFYAAEGRYFEFHDIYESNAYSNTPSFITTDSILHLYHIFFDFTLRRIEEKILFNDLARLTGEMLGASLKQYETGPEELKSAAAQNAVLFAVADRLMGAPNANLPEEIAATVNKEVALVKAHSSQEISPAFSTGKAPIIDYTQFIPRGHYTRSQTLTRYFLGMMWYAQAAFPLEAQDGADKSIARIALLISALDANPNALRLWERLFFPASFLVGAADDPSVKEFSAIMHEVYGPAVTPDKILDSRKMMAMMTRLEFMDPPRIAPFLGFSFRFMPQRFTLDGHIIQDMVFDTVPPDVGTLEKPRYFAMGLDIMAALGSPLAEDLLIKTYRQDQYENYTKQLGLLKKEFADLDSATWEMNIYNGWLGTIMPLLAEKGAPCPEFMRGRRWGLKALNTALGNWTELKHDTILYAKQPMAAEGGDAWTEAAVQPEPVGYVEPELEVYTRLAALTRRTRVGLAELGLMPDDLAARFSKLESLVLFLKYVAEKELSGIPPDEHDGPRIKRYGAEVEALMLQISEGVQTTLADKRAALVADVQTSLMSKPGEFAGEEIEPGSYALEEATGYVDSITVLVDMGGYRQICRGGIYSYYEFTQPASERLTDEAWQEMLDYGEPPGRPVWFKELTVNDESSGGE